MIRTAVTLAENGLKNKPYKDLTVGDLEGLSLEEIADTIEKSKKKISTFEALNNITAKRYEESRRDDSR